MGFLFFLLFVVESWSILGIYFSGIICYLSVINIGNIGLLIVYFFGYFGKVYRKIELFNLVWIIVGVLLVLKFESVKLV